MTFFFRRGVVAVLLLGLLLRLFLIFFITPRNQVGPYDDDGDYFRFARTMVLHGVIAAEDPATHPQTVRAWRGPLFFTFQYLIFRWHGLDSFLAIRIYLSILSLLIPLAVFLFCRRLWDDRVAFVALIWATFHPAFIHYAIHVQSDSFALLFTTWGLMLLMTQEKIREAGFSGFLLGVAILGRSQFSLVAAGSFFWLLINPRFEKQIRRALLFGLMCVIPLVPWWIRNYRVFDRFVPFTTEGGYTLYIGFNDWTDGGGNTRPSPHVPAGLGEIERDRWHLREAVSYMTSHPRRSLKLAASKFTRFWGIIPRVGGWKVKLVGFLSYAPLFFFFFWGMWLWRKRFWYLSPVACLCVYYSGLHMFFPAVIRYRLPIEPFMIAVAAATLVDWFRRGKLSR